MILVEWNYCPWTGIYSAGGRFVASDNSVENGVLWGECSVGTLVVISIPETCSKYFVCLLFACLRTSSYCRMHIIIQSRRWTLCKQQHTRIVKRKKLAFIGKAAYGQIVYTKSKRLRGNNLVKFQLC